MSRSTSSAFPSLPEAGKPLQNPGGRKELTHRRRRPRTPLQPGEGLLLIKGQCCGLLERIVDPDALDDAAIPWGLDIRHPPPPPSPAYGSDPTPEGICPVPSSFSPPGAPVASVAGSVETAAKAGSLPPPLSRTPWQCADAGSHSGSPGCSVPPGSWNSEWSPSG